MSSNKQRAVYNGLVKIGKAAKVFGVVPQTLRVWERDGKIVPARVNESGTRWYDLEELVEQVEAASKKGG